MNKYEKEVMKYFLEREKEVISELKEIYRRALDEIGDKIRAMMSDELTQSKIYRIEYQRALKGQISAILDVLNSNQYDSIQEYLKSCYVDGFIGTLYSLNGYGLPLIFPIEQEQVVNALMTDSKISEGMYKKLGHNVSELKKSISQEISRGLSTSMSYFDIARNLQSRSNVTINQSMNIVQTEGHRIQSVAALASGKKAAAKGASLIKTWDSTLDKKTRPSHRKLDGQVRELDEDFEVDGMKADSPGHFGKPSEDCRCRCIVLIKPRWDVDGGFTKRDNETKELLEFKNVKNYDEFKKKYWDLVDKSGGSGIIRAEIKKGNIKLEINHEKQARHIKGEPEYKDGKSYLTISEKEAQEIINQKSGTGIVVLDKNGKWKNKELINCDSQIGIDVDSNTGEETSTDKGTIHYSKTGTHLVPRKEEKHD